MNNIGLNRNDQDEIREFMQKTLNTREKQTEYNGFFEIISSSMIV